MPRAPRGRTAIALAWLLALVFTPLIPTPAFAVAGQLEFLTPSPQGTSSDASISRDGSHVAFLSTSTGLTAADSDRQVDLYVAAIGTPGFVLADTTSTGTKASAA